MTSPLEWLFSLERFGMKLGLASMRTICETLGHPERAFRSVHVAGTNGKGSVTAMVETALRTAGYRAARYTSPHLVRLEERFVVDGAEITTDALTRSAARIRQAVESLVGSGALETWPTFFECTTAIAFDLFREAQVDVAVVEVGLGGRLDATNVLTPAVTAIVSIAFDHQVQLGTTLTAIAEEKAGIAKPGVPMVCGVLPGEARAAIERMCAERGAPLVDATDERLLDRVRGIPLALAGEHQVGNAAVAVRILDTLDEAGIRIEPRAVLAGLTETRWPGRLERFDVRGMTVLVDAAHNPAGARALAAFVGERWPEGVTVVFGAMADKAVDEMLANLAPIARAIVCTTAPSPRAMPADAVAVLARRHLRKVRVVEAPAAALEAALDAGGPVVVCGSIFLIGPLRERLAGPL